MKEGIEKNNNFRQEQFEKKFEFLSHVTDGLGKDIEPGILEQVTYLNLLGFHTSASCEGHTDGWGYPFGYILFGTDNEFNSDSVINKVYNEVRDNAFELEKKKFPEFDGTPETYSEEIDNFFGKNIEEGLKNHPQYDEYLAEMEIENEKKELEKNKVFNLVEEFKGVFPEYAHKIYISQELASPNIYFTNEADYRLYSNKSQEEGTLDLKSCREESLVVMAAFNNFVKNKYFKS